MDEDWVVLCQALFQAIGEEELTKKKSLQKDRCKESWAKNCWSGQGGVAKDGAGTSSQQRRDWKLPSTEGRHCGSLSLETWKGRRVCVF